MKQPTPRLTDADLALLRPEELQAYVTVLEQDAILQSPLSYAVEVSGAQEYPHQQMLDAWIVALIEGRLYFDGPGPAPVDSGEVDDEGTPIFVHPGRGDRPVYNLAISMPPRHGKSYLVSEHLPAWFLTKYQLPVMLASYNESFAGEWGEKVRDHIVEHPEFGVEVRNGINASKTNFQLVGSRAFMKCAGVGGTLTGKGGPLLIVDDPVKNDEEAMSPIIRERHDNWWKSTFYTRRECMPDGTPGRVVLMATRWHEDDLTGRRVPADPVLGDTWALLNLPALALADDPLGREEGAALCPARVGRGELLAMKKEVGEQWFNALYQGQPSLDDGNVIQRPFHYWRQAGPSGYELTLHDGRTEFVDMGRCYRFGTLDLAASDKKHADWTVMAVWDITPTDPRYLVLAGMERVRMTTEHHERLVIEWYEKWGLRALHIEDKTFGTNLIGRLIGQSGMIVQRLSGDTNKIVRAMPVQYEVRNGRVFFPAEAEWLTEFEAELTKFPLTKHDDMVDAVAYGVQVFQNLPGFVQKRREPETMDERVWEHKRQLGRKSKRSLRSVYPTLGRM